MKSWWLSCGLCSVGLLFITACEAPDASALRSLSNATNDEGLCFTFDESLRYEDQDNGCYVFFKGLLPTTRCPYDLTSDGVFGSISSSLVTILNDLLNEDGANLGTVQYLQPYSESTRREVVQLYNSNDVSSQLRLIMSVDASGELSVSVARRISPEDCGTIKMAVAAQLTQKDKLFQHAIKVRGRFYQQAGEIVDRECFGDI